MVTPPVDMGRSPHGLYATGESGAKMATPEAPESLTPPMVEVPPMADTREVGNKPVVPLEASGARPYPG